MTEKICWMREADVRGLTCPAQTMSCLILQIYKIIRPDKAGAIAICVQGERRRQVYLDYAE
ncbi:MAG: hypothetical protein PUD40_08765, partial [Bacteroidales bacterium]|nr:hypothetical protein [Bacteroidales bacterium]